MPLLPVSADYIPFRPGMSYSTMNVSILARREFRAAQSEPAAEFVLSGQ
jgi:hypothetical protein